MRLISILFFSFVVSSLTGNAGPVCENNLIKNPGVEKWKNVKGIEKPVYFDLRLRGRKGMKDAVFAKSGKDLPHTEKHSGNYSLYLQTTTWGQGVVLRGFKVKAGYRYKISFHAKVLSGNIRLGVCFSHRPWTYLGKPKWSIFPANGKWTEYERIYTIPEACKMLSVCIFLQKGNGYIDDVEAVELGKAKEPDSDSEKKMPLLKGKVTEKITRTGIAVFDESEFPSESPRCAAWYEKVLKNRGFRVERLSCKEIRNPEKFNASTFDTLIFPTGGFFPCATGEQVERFLSDGGTVLIDGAMTTRVSRNSPEVEKLRRKLKKDYENGVNIYEYKKFLAKTPVSSSSNVYFYNESKKKWMPKLRDTLSYDNPAHQMYFKGFQLQPWPNPGGSAQTYARPYNEDVFLNEELKKLVKEMPEKIPAYKNPSRLTGALRMIPPAKKNKISSEFAFDVIVPVYKFKECSGTRYNAFPEAGKDDKDKESDFFIARYHNQSRNGGTLVHFGNAGTKLLSGSDAEKVLLASLKLAEAALPGEYPPGYIKIANQARKLFSDYSWLSFRYRDYLEKYAAVAAAGNDWKKVETCKKKFTAEEQEFKTLSGDYDRSHRKNR